VGPKNHIFDGGAHWRHLQIRLMIHVRLRCDLLPNYFGHLLFIQSFGPIPYLADGIRRVAEVDGRRHLRSAASTALVVPPFVDRRSVTGLSLSTLHGPAWNSLPSAVPATPSLLAFRRQLRLFLFRPYWLNFRCRLRKVPP